MNGFQELIESVLEDQITQMTAPGLSTHRDGIIFGIKMYMFSTQTENLGS